MRTSQHPHFLFSLDDFYDDIGQVHRAAREATYHQMEHVTGWRSTTVYHEPGVKKKLERLLGVKITRWDTDPDAENGVFYQGFSQGAKAETPGVHADWPYDDITALIYLTPGLPIDCGTSLWQHKQTGVSDSPTARDARRLKMPLADLRKRLDEDAYDRSRWVEVARVGYQCNRLVAYPSGCLHSATRHHGASNADGRLYQTFRVGVDWSTFRCK